MVQSVGISNVNAVNMFNAMKAFSPKEEEVQKEALPEVSDGIAINEDISLKKEDINEIMMFAKTAGEENISQEDIKYGFTYGRSVIADYIA